MNDLFEPNPARNELPEPKEQLQAELQNVAREFEELQEKAMHLRNALTKEGAGVEAGQVDNEVVSLQSQLLAFRQQKDTDLNSEVHSLSQRKKTTGSIRSEASSISRASSSSSTRRVRFAELERIRIQQQYEQQATELQLQD